MEKEDILSFLKETNGTMYESIQGNMSTDSATAMTQAALTYGMYLSYNRANGNEDAVDSTKMLSVMTGQSSDSAAFREYLDSPQGQKDLDAYLAALNMIDSNTQANEGLVNDAIYNGFNTADLQELLAGAMK